MRTEEEYQATFESHVEFSKSQTIPLPSREDPAFESHVEFSKSQTQGVI